MKSMIYLFLIIIFYACTNQIPPNSSAKEAIVDKGQPIEIERDTNLRLNFSSGVCAILEDSKGNFWFGSHQEGVCKFDGKTFTYFTEKDGLTNNQVRSIKEDAKGNIWFGTANGVDSYDGEKIINHTGKDVVGIPIHKTGKWQIKPTDLWFHAGNQKGAYRFDGEELIYLPFPISEKKDENLNYLVTGISKGKNNQVWLATYQGVIGYRNQYVLQPKTDFTFINDGSLGLKGENSSLHVRSVFEDSKGNLWFGNNGIGVYLYDGKNFVNFTEQQGLSIKDKGKIGSLGRIFSIGEDSEGNIWFGSRDNGAWRYDGKRLTNYHKNEGLTSSMVWEIYKDKKGKMWFGLGDGSVWQFNGNEFVRVY